MPLEIKEQEGCGMAKVLMVLSQRVEDLAESCGLGFQFTRDRYNNNLHHPAYSAIELRHNELFAEKREELVQAHWSELNKNLVTFKAMAKDHPDLLNALGAVDALAKWGRNPGENCEIFAAVKNESDANRLADIVTEAARQEGQGRAL